MLLYKSSQGKHLTAMFTTSLAADILIQNPEITSPGLVELKFEKVTAQGFDAITGYPWFDSVEVSHVIEVDTTLPVSQQVEWVSGYLAESLQAAYIGHCAYFRAVDDNPDWF